MISDFVKGSAKFSYPEGIQHGIALHRAIDTFTDSHEVTRQAKEVFRPHYRLYSGAFIDVVYDHFLAIDEKEFPQESLHSFSQRVYSTLDNYQQQMPQRFAGMFPYMKEQNWLYNYRHHWGIEKSLGGVVRRAAYLSESDTAFQLFQQHYQLLQDCYRHFWPTIKDFILEKFDALQK
jgi:acyl carrier protein phosphodiesterase